MLLSLSYPPIKCCLLLLPQRRLCSRDSVVQTSKALIIKCLNRTTADTEISGPHVSHFLLGPSDKKASHSFIRLNLHFALGWINE